MSRRNSTDVENIFLTAFVAKGSSSLGLTRSSRGSVAHTVALDKGIMQDPVGFDGRCCILCGCPCTNRYLSVGHKIKRGEQALMLRLGKVAGNGKVAAFLPHTILCCR